MLLYLLFCVFYLTNAYVNPIVPKESADPWVVLSNGNYYYMHTTGNTVSVWQDPRLEQVNSGRRSDLYTIAPNNPIKSDIWAPELWFLDGVWMAYATGNTVGNIQQGPQQIFALRATTADPMGPYTYVGLPLPGVSALDATVLVSPTNAKYLVWSQWESEGQCLWIGPLSADLATVGQPRVRISCPDQPWEKLGGLVNEGPEVLALGNTTHIIYSASFCGTPDYCLGQLTNHDGNFLNAASWVKKTDAPVFRRSDANKVWGVGHCSFTKSRDLTESWIVYHGMDNANGGEPDRSSRIQKFVWNVDAPNFGIPVPAGVPYPDPSGEYKNSTKLESERFVSAPVYDEVAARRLAYKIAMEKFAK